MAAGSAILLLVPWAITLSAAVRPSVEGNAIDNATTRAKSRGALQQHLHPATSASNAALLQQNHTRQERRDKAYPASCVCLREEIDGLLGIGSKKIVDFDTEADFGSDDQCGIECHETCKVKSDYLLSPEDRELFGISIDTDDEGESLIAARCDKGKCKCMDVHRTVEILHKKQLDLKPKTKSRYASPESCMEDCKCKDKKTFGAGDDFEGVCMLVSDYKRPRGIGIDSRSVGCRSAFFPVVALVVAVTLLALGRGLAFSW